MEGKVETLRYDKYEKKEFVLDVDCKEMLMGAAADATVLACNAIVAAGRCEVLTNEAIIEGAVRFCAVIKDGQGNFDSLVRTERFTYNAPIEGVSPKAYIMAMGNARKVKGVIEAGSLMFSCEVRLNAELVTPNEIKIVTDMNSADVHTLSSELQADEIVAKANARFEVRQDLELSVRMPEIKDALCSCAGVIIKEVRCAEQQMMVSGEISVQTLYSCEDEYEPIAQIADKLDFSQILDVKGVSCGLDADCSIEIEEIFVSVNLNEQGERRLLSFECMLNASVQARESHTMRIIKDAFSTQCKLDIVSKKIMPYTQELSMNNSCVERFNVQLPSGNPPMARICGVQLSHCILESKAWDGKAILNCEAEISVVYIAAISGSIECFKAFMPFALQIDNSNIMPEHMLNAAITLEQMQAVMAGGNEAEVRVTFAVKLEAYNKKEQTVLTSCDRGDMISNEGSAIIIYIMQPGDTLWSVCRRLGIGIEDLKAVNPEAGDNPPVGTRLLVYRQLKP